MLMMKMTVIEGRSCSTNIQEIFYDSKVAVVVVAAALWYALPALCISSSSAFSDHDNTSMRKGQRHYTNTSGRIPSYPN